MPSLIRFLFIVGALAGLVYLGMVALATYVVPDQHQITVTIPTARLNK
ncbi:histidine kinase [Methylovirgula sp. HY1]|nr:histidine kinase [Methylovirgula sp. HY1]QXX75315.1 hypothetical protein MHY1_02134 [Methylovirgula sp. HY1]